jgi:hypothetical protein
VRAPSIYPAVSKAHSLCPICVVLATSPTPVSLFPTFDGGQTDASLAMDVDEDLSDDTMCILQLQMKQSNSNKRPASNMVR